LIDVTSNCFYSRFASADAASGSSSSCRYVKGQWSECDSNTNTRSRTLSLKKGDKSCEQTKTIQKKCKKGESAINVPHRRKKQVWEYSNSIVDRSMSIWEGHVERMCESDDDESR